MSAFKEEITLENAIDRGLANRGYIKEGEIRTLTVQAIPDTGAWTLMVDPVKEQLVGVHGDQSLHILYAVNAPAPLRSTG
ncbi:MAG: hypothetical protein LBF74_09730 [Treponema sp.]|jgi:hypothetical protein|nr:hypothetical protein [Treponema sp.]